MAYRTWMEYKSAIFPTLALNKTKEDCCDLCVKLTVALDDDKLTELEKQEIRMVLNNHEGNYKAQRTELRRMMATFLGNEVADLSVAVIPMGVDDPVNDVPANPTRPKVLLQCEDFGGNLTAPFYIGDKPSMEYYSSNLLLHIFVVANASDNKNHVYMYDERAAGKGANEMCSLRFMYHLRKWIKHRDATQEQPYDTLVMVMDNCVGQNKSHVCMMFGCLLSLLFYQKVVFFFLPSGHSHMQADRVVGWVKAALKKHTGPGHEGNLYAPDQYIQLMNSVKSVEAEFIDHRSDNVDFFGGWEDLLTSHFKPIKADILITKHYHFEFEKGQVLLKNNCSSAEYRAWDFVGKKDIDTVRADILRSIFGPDKTLNNCTTSDIQLTRLEQRVLSTNKLSSLAEKLLTIPVRFRDYYPVSAEQPSLANILPSKSVPPKKVAKSISSAEKLLIASKLQKSLLSYYSPKSVSGSAGSSSGSGVAIKSVSGAAGSSSGSGVAIKSVSGAAGSSSSSGVVAKSFSAAAVSSSSSGVPATNGVAGPGVSVQRNVSVTISDDDPHLWSFFGSTPASPVVTLQSTRLIVDVRSDRLWRAYHLDYGEN
eukprot:gene14524-16672_t